MLEHLSEVGRFKPDRDRVTVELAVGPSATEALQHDLDHAAGAALDDLEPEAIRIGGWRGITKCRDRPERTIEIRPCAGKIGRRSPDPIGGSGQWHDHVGVPDGSELPACRSRLARLCRLELDDTRIRGAIAGSRSIERANDCVIPSVPLELQEGIVAG
jgi:hypothetical protein